MAEKTALQIAQEFCRRQGLPQPSTLVGSQDDTIQQVLGLMNEGISDLIDRYQWQQCRHGLSFTHGNLGSFVAIDFDVTVPGFASIIPRTLWDTTSRIEVAGPYTDQEWRVLTTMLIATARYNYSLLGNKLRIFPVPNPVTSINFQMNWYSKYGVQPPGGGTGQAETYASDESAPLIPTRVVLQDLKWRWRKEKGLPYAEDQRTCEQLIENAIAREPTQTLVLDSPDPGTVRAGPGLFIPAGSWNLP